MKIFGREPALWLEAAKAALVGLALILPGLDDSVQNAVMVILVAVIALVQAIKTRPFQVVALTGFIQTVGISIAAFGIDVSGVTLAALVTLTGAVAALIARAQITPAADPRPVGGVPIQQL